MGRNRPERQSGRVLAVKLGVVLVGLVILLALGYAGGRYLEKRRYTILSIRISYYFTKI